MDDSAATNADRATDNNAVAVVRHRGPSIVRTTFRYGTRVGLISLVVSVFFGLFPPWPVVIVFVVGLLATIAFIAAKKHAIATGVAVLSVVGSCWLVRPVVDVRAATASDRVYERYFGIDSYGDTAQEIQIRNVVVATGTLTLNTWLSASLYHVKAGDIQEINAFSVGRSPNQIGAPYWVDMRIMFALGDRTGPSGRITQLGSAGHSRGGGRGGDATNDVQRHESKTLPGRFTSGTKRIVYVEGDSGINVDHTMTVERFAKENNGNHLVVELGLN